jgi:hypothetical protein
MTMRSAVLDLSNVVLSGAEVLEYLSPATLLMPKTIAVKPDPFDPCDDVAIDPTKWSVTGVVTEGPFLGVDGLHIDGGATPTYDQAGVIYKPPITASIGKLIMARAIVDHPVEYVICLQEYAFTVDSVLLPTTWTLKYLVAPQDLRNSMGVRVAPGALYFFEGGVGGNEEFVSELPTKLSKVGEIYPLQIGFLFTATGFEVWAHIPGIWTQAKLVKTYIRPGASHAVYGYSLCTNLYTADNSLHFYDLGSFFKSNTTVTGARIIASNLADTVPVGSLLINSRGGFVMERPGLVMVRVPDYSPALLTLDQLAQVVFGLTGKHAYEVQFELSGDVALIHPQRVSIDDVTLPATPSVTPA